MSKRKSLTDDQLEEIKKLVVEGVRPQKIADLYNVGISTIHNYKNAFKKEGLKFSSVRGREVGTKVKKSNEENTNNTSTKKQNATEAASLHKPSTIKTFIINGTTINVSGSIKSINIDDTSKGIIIKVTL